MTQRWRYEDTNGRAIWLAFDSAFPCIYCDAPVGSLSLGGPAVCPMCDCGCHKDGRLWGNDAWGLYDKAKARLRALADDPVWVEYEAAVGKGRP